MIWPVGGQLFRASPKDSQTLSQNRTRKSALGSLTTSTYDAADQLQTAKDPTGTTTFMDITGPWCRNPLIDNIVREFDDSDRQTFVPYCHRWLGFLPAGLAFRSAILLE